MKKNNKRYIYKSGTVKCDEFHLIIKNGQIFNNNLEKAIIDMNLFRDGSMFELNIVYKDGYNIGKYVDYLARATVFIDNDCVLNGIHVTHTSRYVLVSSYYQIRNKDTYKNFVKTLRGSTHTMDIYITYTNIKL